MTPRILAQRRRVLFTMLTTLGFHYPPGREPPVIAGIRQYLDGWPGVGRIVAGMARQQYDLRLTRYGGHGWEATFYPEGIGHSVTPKVGTGWAWEPGTTVQRAAWEALRRRRRKSPDDPRAGARDREPGPSERHQPAAFRAPVCRRRWHAGRRGRPHRSRSFR